MSYSLNNVQLIGHLGKDPEMKSVGAEDTSLCNFSVATTKKYKKNDGTQVDKTEWHNCVAWRKLADIIGNLARKGSKVYVEGELTYETYENKDGVKMTATKVVVNDFIMLDGRDPSNEYDQTQNSPEPEKDDLPF